MLFAIFISLKLTVWQPPPVKHRLHIHLSKVQNPHDKITWVQYENATYRIYPPLTLDVRVKLD